MENFIFCAEGNPTYNVFNFEKMLINTSKFKFNHAFG